ncbi:unnamed protein product [Rotaria sp. Silwood2]|nr:unnamed protein product [Rotaria sp. Silwood2]CAF4198698.1 unnamed protein product [Rotaria sp. Silwood2]CAF4489438.1 unnamed protein product [Rotaria sp. Silwood2]
MPKITFSESNKGKRILICNGFMYQGEVLAVRKGDHSSHLSSPEHIELLKFKSNVKQRIIAEATPISRIYDEELAKAQLSQTALSIVSSAQDAKSSLNRIRRRETPVLPKSCHFDIPTLFAQTLNGERFLLYDKMRRNKRIVIFATDDQLRILFKAKRILMYDAFSSCPPFLDQIYTLHAIKYEQSFPYAFALLTGRPGSVYKELFKQLEEEAERLQMQFLPNQITTDSEQALVKQLRE